MAQRKSARPSRGQRRGRSAGELPGDLEARLGELQQELFTLRFQFATRQLTNTARFRAARREVARIKTMQRQRELAAATS